MFGHVLAQDANIVGVTGVILILITYTMLQMNKMSALSVTYSLMNTIGAMLILISLYFYWNLASGIIEICWLIISLFGLTKAIHRRLKKQRQ